MNQKGYSLVVFILIIFSLCSLIIGGSYVYKTQFLSKQSLNQTVDNKQSVDPSTKLSIRGRVLFVSKKGDMNLASPDGGDIVRISNEKQFSRIEDGLPPSIVSISPDSSKIIFSSYVRYSSSEPDNPDYKIGNSRAYYVSTVDGKDIRKIDLTKFIKLGNNLMVYFVGWSADGNKIVFKASSGQGVAQFVIGDYDPISEEIRSIYTTLDESKAGEVMYYTKNILVVNSQLPGRSDPTNKAYKIDLQTQKIEKFNKPTLISDINMRLYNPYFVTSDAAFDSEERKKITIYSYDQPNTPIAEINVDDPKSNFTNYYVWSPNNNYLAISSGYSQIKNGKTELHRKLNIYSKDGKKIMSRDINNAEYYSGSLFSPDESKFLMVGITTTKDGPKIDIPIWQVLDVKTATQLSEKVISEDLGSYTSKWIE